jgi:multiple sugar transport system substrate-binding protein
MKKLLTVCVLVLCGVMVFAGGQKAEEEVAFWTSHTGAQDAAALQKIVDDYNATNPAVKVKMTQVPGSQTEVTKLMTAVRSGTGPDVYMLDRFTIAQRASDGMLEDITDVLARLAPDFSSNYHAFAWAETQWKKRTYGIPFDTDCRAFYYRKDLIREAGYDPAIFEPQNGPITLDKVKEIAFKLNKMDAQGNYTHVGLLPTARTFSQGTPYVWGFAYGAEYMDFAAGKVTPLHPDLIKAYQFAYDWNKEMDPQKVNTFISTYYPPNNPPEQHPFMTGRVAMLPHGDWFLSSMRDYAPDVEYGVTWIPMPTAGSKPTSMAGGWSYVVPKGSKKVEAAIRFIMYACGANGQRVYTRDTAHLPTWKALMNEDIFTPEHQFFKSYLDFCRSRPVLPIGAMYYNSLYRAWDDVALNKEPPEVALKKVEDELQPQLSKFLPLQ